MNVCILEDEIETASVIKSFVLKYCFENNIFVNVTIFNDSFDLIESKKFNYDIFLLDIQLPHINGMDVGKKIREENSNTVIIFITNLANFAIQGYSVGALDFILKPVSYNTFSFRFKNACNLVQTIMKRNVTLVLDGKLRSIDSNEILYFEIMDHKIVVHTLKKTYFAYGTLKEIEKSLSNVSSMYERCNSCYLVNLYNIKEIDKDSVLIGNVSLKISKNKKKNFIKKYRESFL